MVQPASSVKWNFYTAFKKSTKLLSLVIWWASAIPDGDTYRGEFPVLTSRLNRKRLYWAGFFIFPASTNLSCSSVVTRLILQIRPRMFRPFRSQGAGWKTSIFVLIFVEFAFFFHTHSPQKGHALPQDLQYLPDRTYPVNPLLLCRSVIAIAQKSKPPMTSYCLRSERRCIC